MLSRLHLKLFLVWDSGAFIWTRVEPSKKHLAAVFRGLQISVKSKLSAWLDLTGGEGEEQQFVVWGLTF